MRRLQIIALFTLTIGWFPFMWIAVWGSWHRDYAMWVLILGFLLCLISGMIVGGLLSKKALWLNQEEYEKEVQKFRDAKEKYEKATLELVKLQKISE